MYSHFGPVDLRASTNSQRTFKHCCQGLIRELTASNIPVYNVTIALVYDMYRGVSMDNILDKVRNNVTREYEMVYLLNKKDLYNIEWAYNLRNEQRYQNDSISVRLLLQQLTEGKQNLVLLYIICTRIMYDYAKHIYFYQKHLTINSTVENHIYERRWHQIIYTVYYIFSLIQQCLTLDMMGF